MKEVIHECYKQGMENKRKLRFFAFNELKIVLRQPSQQKVTTGSSDEWLWFWFVLVFVEMGWFETWFLCVVLAIQESTL